MDKFIIRCFLFICNRFESIAFDVKN